MTAMPMPVVLALLVSAAHSIPIFASAEARNGFMLEPASIPLDEILAGGPPRDGIPALDGPPAVPSADAPWTDDDFVLGIRVGGEARAYPLGILTWHELVNDTLGGTPILVSFCPLCGTGLVFERRIEGQTLRFGVSGLLYRSDVLMFDRESDSLWSQIEAEAVTGARLGQRLTLLRSAMMRWGDWRAQHPHTTVLSRETGHRRDYDRSPYGGYAQSDSLRFPAPVDRRYHPKMPTLGLRVRDGPSRAYPASELARVGGSVSERFAGHAVRVAYHTEGERFDVTAPPEVEVIEGYWFAWAAFHPETTVFTAPAAGPASAPARKQPNQEETGGSS